MAKRKQDIRTYILCARDNFTPTAAGRKAFVPRTVSLFTNAEGIENSDGYKAKIINWRMKIRTYCDDVYTINPVLIQTAGNVNDSIDQTSSTLADLINGGVDDVFGFQKLGGQKLAKVFPNFDSKRTFKREFELSLPRKFLDLLNKEVETERLQELYIGFCFCTTGTNQINIELSYEVDFVSVRKQIINR